MAMHLARAESGLYVSRVTQNYMDCWMASQAKKAAEVEMLRNTLAAIYNKIEGNTRALARDLVNRAFGLSNDVHPTSSTATSKVHGAVVFLLAFVIFLIGYFAGKEI